jgi:hypothetical protein
MPDEVKAVETVVHFFMTEPREARTKREDGLPGKFLARYLPGLSYRLTPKNQPFVDGWLKEGVAHFGVLPGSAAALGFSARGTVITKKEG